MGELEREGLQAKILLEMKGTGAHWCCESNRKLVIVVKPVHQWSAAVVTDTAHVGKKLLVHVLLQFASKFTHYTCLDSV